MVRVLDVVAIVAVATTATAQQQSDYDPLQYVDPLIGSANGGNVFAGASIPYGMAKAVADVDSQSNQGGFSSDGGNVTGFSTMHDSGTGGSPSLGTFAFFAYPGCDGDDINRCVFPKNARKVGYVNDSIKAKPGSFEISLVNGLSAAMTTTHHTSLFSFTFSEPSTSPLILLDLTDLQNSRQDNASISVDADTGRMTGSARFLPSFGSGNYLLHFCADFKGPSIRDNGIFANSRASADVKDLQISRSINGYPLPGGGFIRFGSGEGPLLARIATSFISPEQACSHAEEEIGDFDFDRVKKAAEDMWREKLSPIKLDFTGVDPDLVKNFYSGVYRTMVNPQDYTGENPLWKSDEPYFDSFYCLWDSFRSQIPMLTIIDTTAVARMIRSLIETYVHVGWLPDCRMTLCKGFTQGGSNADNVLVDAYVKGVSDGIDWDLGYQAVVKDAEVEPYDWSNQGRGGLDSWKSLGYIPVQDFDYKGFGTMTRSISRTLEYSYNDFVIAHLASRLGGREADVQKYLGRSGNWQNLYKANQTSMNFDGSDTGYTGFFQPRYLNGTFGFQDPLKCANTDSSGSVCSLQNSGAETFESSIWEYSYFVPHDQATLISLFGGPENFVKRLDYLHDQNITYIGNEPSFLTVFQYHYAGRPAKSALRSHFYIPRFFSTTPAGLPGNDDSGAMGSFVAMSMMGLFPNPGQDVYFIIPPYFPSVSITSPATNKTASVRVTNFDPTYAAVYIQNVTLDGQPYTRNWIDHSFFTDGKELVITVGSTESAWGTRVEDLPPSVGEYVGFNGSAPAKRMERRMEDGREEAAGMGRMGLP
ncbi:glycoside hydrolase family 92 protein [Pseudovirgaria hyperparasitica]|uniref:Glycoside hydrolase family 92 protein n=1 Tax=Pseudovirgaria hyperparasitica TaxID=470096 RepID=A0A6A6W6L4_9PEZI|nr:glycoside hydrolase family 92 protein [Pseudovirgaria hyperparasitica]KAF2757600.1 glycoside hydrolase family 92 protein [Pseudovirgaria hyperparasitica]